MYARASIFATFGSNVIESVYVYYIQRTQTANAYKLAAACKFARVAFHRLSTEQLFIMEGHVNEISDLCVFNSKRMEETPRCLFYASGNELRADRKVAVVPAFTIRRDCVETQFP